MQIYDVGQLIESAVDGVVDALGLAIPVALVGTFAIIQVFGFSINQLTLLGLKLATGLVVDDAMVVVEGVTAKIEAGMRPRQAAHACMGELFCAIIATSLVLMAVFVPVAFYPGGIGIIYRQFALTIAFSIGICIFNAITFSPMMAALLFRAEPAGRPRGWG